MPNTTPHTSPKRAGIAARAGHWSARHRKKAIVGWLAFVLIALFVGGSLGTKEIKDADTYNGESRTAERIIDDAGYPADVEEMVLVQSTTQTTADPAFRDAVADVKRAVSAQAVVERITGTQVSK